MRRCSVANADRSRVPEICGDFRYFHAHLLAGSMPRAASMEIMTHPGASTDDYLEETVALQSDWFPLLQAQVPSARLVSYLSL